MKHLTVLTLVSAGMALGGCATFSKDAGFDSVKQITQQSVPQQIAWPRTEAEQSVIAARVQELLQAPHMDADCAVQIALLNNKGLQAKFYELGISEADLVQAGRFPNPRFDMRYAKSGGEYTIEQALTFNIFALLTRPRMQEIERRHFEQAKHGVALEVLRLAHRTRLAYFNAVAATERVRYSGQVQESAEASAELARRMLEVGNWSKLEQAREQGFYADAALDAANAKSAQTAANEALARLLDVPAEALRLQQRLPDLPDTLTELQPAAQAAFEQRLDLQAARLQTEALANQLGLTKTTRFINVLEIGPARVLEGNRSSNYRYGLDLSFELPLFDWGDARVARAEAIYMQAVNRTAQTAIDAESEIREAYSRYRATYDIARRYRDEIVPLRKKILAENQLRYNGMLISPFELLADARAQVTSVNSYIESLREFWLADAALQMTLSGSGKDMTP